MKDEPHFITKAREGLELGKIIEGIEVEESWMRLRLHDGTEMHVKAAQHEFLYVYIAEPMTEQEA